MLLRINLEMYGMFSYDIWTSSVRKSGMAGFEFNERSVVSSAIGCYNRRKSVVPREGTGGQDFNFPLG